MKYFYLKTVVTLFWLAVLANQIVVFPFSVSLFLKVTAIIIILCHLVEYWLYRKIIIQKPQGRAMAFLLTLLYGVIYIKEPFIVQEP